MAAGEVVLPEVHVAGAAADVRKGQRRRSAKCEAYRGPPVASVRFKLVAQLYQIRLGGRNAHGI
ncbi:hypothetical protein [Arthrobacter sp. C152]